MTINDLRKKLHCTLLMISEYVPMRYDYLRAVAFKCQVEDRPELWEGLWVLATKQAEDLGEAVAFLAALREQEFLAQTEKRKEFRRWYELFKRFTTLGGDKHGDGNDGDRSGTESAG